MIGAIAGVGEIAREAFGGGNSASPPAKGKLQASVGQRPGGTVPWV